MRDLRVENGCLQRSRWAPYFIFFVLCTPTRVLAWGGLGHRIVAEEAAWLLDDRRHDAWSQLIWRHRMELGIYAFEPDSRFRHEDGHDGQLEAPQHIWVKETGEGNAPGRIVQLADLARDALHRGEGVEGGYGRSDATPKTRAAAEGLYYLGVLSHYTADAGVPFHGSTNMHAFDTGQGGLHFYFESDCVNALEPGLAVAALAAARAKREQWSKDAAALSTTALIERLFLDSAKLVPEVVRLDAQHALLSRGRGKDFAVRKSATVACKAFEPILVQRLARAIWLTAEVWQRALPQGPGPSATLQFSDLTQVPFVVPK